MGLINITHQQMTQALVDMQSDIIKNPYYLFNDKKATSTTYFNINTSKSTLDKNLKIAYDDLGVNCPLRYNQINGFYLYGIDRITASLENGEFGVEANEISGEAVILPNTIKPYPGDYFCIDMLKQHYLFRVNNATIDTLDNGANYYTIQYTLERNNANLENIKCITVEEYQFSANNVGSNFNPIVKQTKWNIAIELDKLSTMLKEYFQALYFNEYVQTYTYVHMYQVCQYNLSSDYFYDPYLIQFIMNNGIMKHAGEYHYISHKTILSPQFPIIYNNTFWHCLETGEMDDIDACKVTSSATAITTPGTIFMTRYENYFELNYQDTPLIDKFAPVIHIINPEIIGFIKEKQLFKSDTDDAIYNIIIKYFNHKENLTMNDIVAIQRIGDSQDIERNYFLIPMLIFCIEQYEKKLLSKDE